MVLSNLKKGAVEQQLLFFVSDRLLCPDDFIINQLNFSKQRSSDK